MIASPFQPYIDAVLAERDWSWAVIGILYVLAGCFVRGWFISPVFSRLKGLEKPLAQNVKALYLKHSVPGWFLFFMPLILIVLSWRKNVLPLVVREEFLIAGGAACFVLSVIFHLQAYGIASLLALRQASEEFTKKRYEV